MNFSLEVTDYTQPIEKFSDRILFGAEMILIGLAVVFAVLMLIWGILALYKNILVNKSKAKNVSVVSQPIVEEPVCPPAEEEIVAVIAAAIAAAESETNGIKFRVVSFRRK